MHYVYLTVCTYLFIYSGLFLTYLGLYLMQGHGQPALMYLVPCTLGLIVALSAVRDDLKDLWSCDCPWPTSPCKLWGVQHDIIHQICFRSPIKQIWHHSSGMVQKFTTYIGDGLMVVIVYIYLLSACHWSLNLFISDMFI